MKINPDYKNLLAYILTVEDPEDILKECFALECEDWDNAFDLIEKFGCSNVYEERFSRLYKRWSLVNGGYFEPFEWLQELETEMKENKTNEEEKNIDDFIVNNFEWEEEYGDFYKEIIKPLLKMNDEVYLKCLHLGSFKVNIDLIVDLSKYEDNISSELFSVELFAQLTKDNQDEKELCSI